MQILGARIVFRLSLNNIFSKQSYLKMLSLFLVHFSHLPNSKTIKKKPVPYLINFITIARVFFLTKVERLNFQIWRETVDIYWPTLLTVQCIANDQNVGTLEYLKLSYGTNNIWTFSIVIAESFFTFFASLAYVPFFLLELQNRLFWILRELHKISFVWKYEAERLNSFLVMRA